MSNEHASWNEADDSAFARLQDLFIEEKYFDCLLAARDLLTRARDANKPNLSGAIVEFILQCARAMTPLDPDQPAKATCSFCSKAPPEVRLGAGPSAFICNECVATLAPLLS
jgi:hypothetical protein